MTEPQRAWVSTGHQQYVGTPEIDRTPEFDSRTGEHLWIWAVSFRAAPDKLGDPTHTPMLDMENLLSISGPGCFYCEQPHSRRLASRRCKGRP